ncbi:3313_t:CDS:2 [Funneliformis geosporum]|uniref:16663_t:CDS:1 n=1 Tax=Funneliformis geosporum TaxID=1117311 RepID=A0A9W4T4W3_9GLOM|nr:16663_t:CDS:2 [Funneliformis geosporum]CAI2193391.1 3313_t:CDS:2 [Funneliformis geosporum]
MPHNKLRVVIQKAFSSEKLRLPKEQIDESRTQRAGYEGVARRKWHFGTVDKRGNQFPPGTNICNTANDPNFTINIPASDIFYDPAIPAIGYIGPMAFPIFYNANVAIDLYRVQQAVLMKQAK